MAEKGDAHVVLHDAAAVVGDAHKGGAAVFDLDGDVLRAGVDGVFHQLLDDGGRTLHDLARRDQLRDVLVQHIDHTHMVTAFLYSYHIF